MVARVKWGFYRMQPICAAVTGCFVRLWVSHSNRLRIDCIGGTGAGLARRRHGDCFVYKMSMTLRSHGAYPLRPSRKGSNIVLGKNLDPDSRPGEARKRGARLAILTAFVSFCSLVEMFNLRFRGTQDQLVHFEGKKIAFKLAVLALSRFRKYFYIMFRGSCALV